jgi:hypothetical protein
MSNAPRLDLHLPEDGDGPAAAPAKDRTAATRMRRYRANKRQDRNASAGDAALKSHENLSEEQTGTVTHRNARQQCLGHIVNRGLNGFEAYNSDNVTLGIFATADDAATAIMRGRS